MLGLALRAGYGIARMVRAESVEATLTLPDEQQYWMMAKSWTAGGGFRDELGMQATRMPVFVGGLGLLAHFDHGLVIAKVLQWVVGACAGLFVAALAGRWISAAAGILAGVLVAIDPFFVYFSSLLLTETLFLTVLCAWWWAGWPLAMRGESMSRRRWALTILLIALCVYVRESSLGLVVFWLAWVSWRRGFDRRSMANAALTIAAIVAALFPWAYRNKQVTGHWCWLTHRGGISLYDGVRPGATGASDLGDVKAAPEVAGLDEVAWNAHFMQKSKDAILDDPARIIRLAGVKWLRTWNPVPNDAAYQSAGLKWISGLWTIPVYVFGIAGIVWIARAKPHKMTLISGLLLPAVFLSFLHMLFVGSVRYRLGAMPMLEVLAAAGVVGMLHRFKRVDSSAAHHEVGGSGAQESPGQSR